MNLARPVGAAMLHRGREKIIFTASPLTVQGGITVPGYTAVKHGVAGLTKDWASRGNDASARGYIVTDDSQALRDDATRSAAIVDRIPAGRWGTADDLARATVFPPPDAADYVNGIVRPVDGSRLGR